MRRRKATTSVRPTSSPSTRTVPASGRTRPFIVLRAVVLPDPLVPSSTRLRPCWSERVTPSSAGGDVRSKRFRTSINSTTGSDVGAAGPKDVDTAAVYACDREYGGDGGTP